MDKTNLSDKRSLVLLRKLEGSWDGTQGTLLGAGTNVCLDLGGGFAIPLRFFTEHLSGFGHWTHYKFYFISSSQSASESHLSSFCG